MPRVPEAALHAAEATRLRDAETGTRRVSAGGLSARCRAAIGAYVLTHPINQWPAFACGDEMRPYWGGYFVASPNPFRVQPGQEEA